MSNIKYPLSRIFIETGIAVALFVYLLFLTANFPGAIKRSAANLSDAYANPNAYNLYVSTTGSDSWSGILSEPNSDKTDGPFATIEKARDAIRELKKNGQFTKPVYVYIRGGTYNLKSTLTFDKSDSGENYGITYLAYQNERPIISGGQKITSTWTSYSSKIYMTNVGSLRFRSLFVNDKRAVKSRDPNTGFYKISCAGSNCDDTPESHISFYYQSGNVNPSWQNVNKIDVFGFHRWFATRQKIDHIDGNSNKVYLADNIDPTGNYCYWGYQKSGNVGDNYFLENVFEKLDNPGEWYLNESTGNLYYYPLPGENISSAEVYAPNLTYLVKVDGTVGSSQSNKLSNINFRGLTFSYGDYLNQSIVISNNYAYWSGTIFFREVTNSSFKNNTIKHTGHNGLYVYNTASGPHNNVISGNQIYDTASYGISTGSNNLEISNNIVYDVGADNRGVAGISITGANCVVKNNLIYNTPNVGISVGQPTAVNNVIENNIIHDVMQSTSDGAGIYVSVNNSNSNITVRNNKVYNAIARPPYTYLAIGIYFDWPSTGITMENNIMYNNDGNILFKYPFKYTIRNNIFANPQNTNIMLYKDADPSPFDFCGGTVISNNIIAASDISKTLFAMNDSSDSCTIKKSNSNNNLFYNVAETPGPYPAGCCGNDLGWWKNKTEFEANSIVANPKFVNPAGENFALQSDSPALKSVADGGIGFNPINESSMGPHLECFNDSECSSGFCFDRKCVYNVSVFCGDSICNPGENCTSCEADCGSCPIDETEAKSTKGAPTNIKTSFSDYQIKLTWSQVENALGYFIYKCEGKNCKPKNLINNVESLTYSDNYVFPGKTYGYVISPYNKLGQEGVRSKTVYVTIESKEEPKKTTEKTTEKTEESQNKTAPVFTIKMYKGVKGEQVSKLQEFLAKDKTIYPQGKITGYYGNLTFAAVARFQLKYGIVKNSKSPGYGLVGPKTREKLNELIAKSK